MISFVTVYDDPSSQQMIQNVLSSELQPLCVDDTSKLPAELPPAFLLAFHLSQCQGVGVVEESLKRLVGGDSTFPTLYGSLAKHVNWITRNWDSVLGLIVLSGPGVPANTQTDITELICRLPGERVRPVGFTSPSTLRSGLTMCHPPWTHLENASPGAVQRLIDELCGSDASVESALQLLCALLPFGLLWEASCETSSQSGLIRAKRDVCLDEFQGFERFIADAVLNGIDGIADATRNPAVARIDFRLSKSTATSFMEECKAHNAKVEAKCQTSLALALQFLTDSQSLPEWNSRLGSLRDVLLLEAPEAPKE